MNLNLAVLDALTKGKKLSPQIKTSQKFKHWISTKDFKRCIACKNNHGKIWYIFENHLPKPPVHLFCRCKIMPMETITAGTATINGSEGADWKIKYERKLPDNYVSKKYLESQGWYRGNIISKFAPGCQFFGGIYGNYDDHLPNKEGRVWYEADINYTSGKRNSQRIVWSNDGLIFVTYDHYETFYEIN